MFKRKWKRVGGIEESDLKGVIYDFLMVTIENEWVDSIIFKI